MIRTIFATMSLTTLVVVAIVYLWAMRTGVI